MSRAQKMENVTLKRVAKSDGATIPKHSYVALSNFIISTLSAKSDQLITLNDLLDKAQKELEHNFSGEMLWYLLQVKHDLEAREIVTIDVDKSRVQRLKLAKKIETTIC
ncbi:MAG TPA: hypothetical protein VFE57_11665 [Cyclobacteriaceae bacterium]|nr:hypothetical protein [Cyclobacteriaceae bacterium]